MKKIIFAVLIVCAVACVAACEKRGETMDKVSENTYKAEKGKAVVYFAGGCFWGTEKLFSQIPGVTDAVSGYANGDENVVPRYEIAGKTHFKETVRVEYDPEKISLETLLFAYFSVTDPTVKNRQGNDIGSQYQTGIYYADEDSGRIIRNAARKEAKKHDRFYVEILPLKNFFDAEEYHQDYLEKNPGGYCHINSAEMDNVLKEIEKGQLQN